MIASNLNNMRKKRYLIKKKVKKKRKKRSKVHLKRNSRITKVSK